MNEFIIVFRECLEASLIVGIIYTILAKSNLRDAIQKLWLGVAASIVASLGVAYVVISLKDALGNNSSMALFEAIFMYITAGLIWYVVFWLSKHVSDRKVLEGQTMTAVKISSWGVFFVTFFAILREGFETVVFLISSFSITESFSYVGFIVGAALAILLGYLVVVQGKRINLKRFFQGTTLLLVFLASGMVAYGTHEVESYLVKSNQLNLHKLLLLVVSLSYFAILYLISLKFHIFFSYYLILLYIHNSIFLFLSTLYIHYKFIHLNYLNNKKQYLILENYLKVK